LEEATGFDGRKDTMFKGGKKYDGFNEQTMLSRGHERWINKIDDIPARNKRSVWTVNTKSYHDAHFATYPEKLIEPCIKSGCPEGGVVLDPFMGAGTTALVAKKLNRNYIGIELNPDYIKIAEKRIFNEIGLFV
jgi:DNA modification methylase